MKGIYEEVQLQYETDLQVEVLPLETFYHAEDYHQDYLVKNEGGYCHLSSETLQFAKTYARITRSLRLLSDEEKKIVLPRFFKTGKGEYGEGDKFLGVTVPKTRKVAKEHTDSPMSVVEALLESEWHECRLCALLMLVQKYKHSKDEVVSFYLSHTKGINNWDLVDLSAPYILGDYLVDKTDRSVLYRLSDSSVLWEQRIAVVSTLMLIRHNQFEDTIRLAEKLLTARHDLMHKAVGWMLREVGKRDEGLLVEFLERHHTQMPRTMVRYAIERLPKERRRY